VLEVAAFSDTVGRYRTQFKLNSGLDFPHKSGRGLVVAPADGQEAKRDVRTPHRRRSFGQEA
jgi:hypothetical protein